MFESLFKKHDPNSQESYGILKFFAEDLNDEQLLEFVNHLEIKGSILLLSEIGFISQNNSVRLKIFSVIEIKFKNWVNEEINYKKEIFSPRPRLTTIKKIEFTNFLLSFNKIGFSNEIELLFKEFIFNSHNVLCRKYFETSFHSLFSSITIEFVKTLGIFLFSLKKDETDFININESIFFYLKELAFSRFIFDIDTDFLDTLNKFRDKLLKNSTLEKSSIWSLLLTEMIIKKELDFEKIKYGDRINNLLHQLQNSHSFELLDLLHFLERFNYNFKDYNFHSQLNYFLYSVDFREPENNKQNSSRLLYIDYIIGNSNLICDYIIFHIKYLSKEKIIDQIEAIIFQFKKIKHEFIDLIGFNNYNKFLKIEGEKFRKNKIISNGETIFKGFLIKILDAEIITKSISHGTFVRDKCHNLNFLDSQINNGYLPPLSNKNKIFNSNRLEKINISNPNSEFFQITKIRYAPSNNGQVFTLTPFSKDLEQLSLIFEIDNLFGKFDLWILDQTLMMYKSNSKFLGISLPSISYHFNFQFGVNKIINSDINSFRKLIESNFPQLFKKVIVKIEKKKDTLSEIKKIFDLDETVKGIITNRVIGKGGYNVLYKNLNGFLPGSLLDLSYFENSHESKKIIKSEIYFKIVSIDEEQNSFILSHKAVTKQEKLKMKEKLFSILEKGLIVEGLVKNIKDYGAFVDIGGIDGLIHITDLSWGRISHPEEILELDQKINVVILDFDAEKKRIALGLKQLQPHPWDSLDTNLNIGDKVSGKIIEIEDYGAFIELATGVEGLIHVSEMSWSRYLGSARDFMSIGDTVEAVILTLDREDRKMSLGIKQSMTDPWNDIETKYAVGSKLSVEVLKFTNFGVFVELEEGVDGLIHISDLSWQKKIKHPSEFCKVGEGMDVIVLEMDRENRRISLGHKQLKENPWVVFESTFSDGSIHSGTIIEMKDKSGIVSLPYGVEGICPAKHLKKEDGQNAKVEETLDFKVIEFNKELKKIVVSHTRTFEEEEDKPSRSAASSSATKTTKAPKKPTGSSSDQVIKENTQKTTLGDFYALAELKKKMEKGEENNGKDNQ